VLWNRVLFGRLVTCFFLHFCMWLWI